MERISINMKVATFHQHYDFEVEGDVFKSAVVLGDVDNDSDIELVIGNMKGDLYIFKGNRQIQKISGLGLITAIAIGDIMNCGSNTLIVISGDGWCHMYLCLKLSKTDSADDCIVRLDLVHVQRIPANTKAILLGDIDGDGMTELVVGLTDRVIRSYRWNRSSTAGRLLPIHKWECANQIGSMIMDKDDEGRPCLLVSQPGATVLRMYCPTDITEMIEKNVELQNFPVTQLRNTSTFTDIIGNIKIDEESKVEGNNESGQFYSVATSDGLLMLIKKQTVLWSINVDQELFSLNKISVEENEPDYVIASSWSGETFIVNHEGEVAKYNFGESFSAFCCGEYTIKPSTKTTVPCFVFVTLSRKVHIYFNIVLPFPNVVSLSKLIESDDELSEWMNFKEQSSSSLKKLIEDCLYNYDDDDDDDDDDE